MGTVLFAKWWRAPSIRRHERRSQNFASWSERPEACSGVFSRILHFAFAAVAGIV